MLEIPVRCAFSQMLPIGDVKPRPDNPNQHPAEQIRLLAKIIKHQAWRGPIVISNQSGLVTRGHGRLLAARELGLETVPVDFQDYDSDKQEWDDVVADNKIAELSSFDEGAMARELAERTKQDAGFDPETLGFSPEEIARMERDLLAASNPAPPATGATTGATPPPSPGSSKTVSFVAKGPTQSGDAFSKFELIMVHTNKTRFVETLDAIRKAEGFDTLEKAIMFLCDLHKPAAKP